MSLALFRVLAWLIKRPSRAITFFVDGALAIYLFHLMWAMIILPKARALPISPEWQWLLATGIVLMLSCASYLAVRSTNITSILFCGAAKKQAPQPKG
jgi:glucan biosynthesis protein C